MIVAAEVYESGLRGKFYELRTECPAVHNRVPTSFVDVVQIAMRSIPLERQQKESDRELKETQR